MPVATIRVSKGKGVVEIDTDKLPEEVYAACLFKGLEHFVNLGMSKITVAKLTGEDLTRAQSAAMEKAAENVVKIMAGNIKRTAAAKTDVPGKVMTEARRLAKNLVKDEMKRQGLKVSHVEASEITKAANAMIEARPELLDMARASLEGVAKVASETSIVSAIPVSAKKVAAAEAAKAAKQAKGAPISAKQASIPAKAKPAKKGAVIHT